MITSFYKADVTISGRWATDPARMGAGPFFLPVPPLSKRSHHAVV